MHPSKPLFVIVVMVAFTHVAFAQAAATTCEGKRADISRDIDMAKAKGQEQRVRGLEAALRETVANCSDAKLQKDMATRIVRQERKVAQDQRDLDKARAQGKPAKIADREAKLAREQTELDRLRSGSH